MPNFGGKHPWTDGRDKPAAAEIGKETEARVSAAAPCQTYRMFS